MELNIAAALKQPSELFEAVIEEEFEEQGYAGRIIAFEEPVRLAFNYSYDGKAFTLRGDASFLVKTSCARCDEPLAQRLVVPFEERFVKGGEEDAYAFTGDTLSLGSMALDNLFLHLPMQSVCKEDCRGLCPVCGVNLNTAQCDCEFE